MRRLPTWLADGPEVSDLAYHIVEQALDGYFELRRGRGRDDLAGTTLVAVVEYLAEELQVDEADVLRGFAELEHVGALTRGDR